MMQRRYRLFLTLVGIFAFFFLSGFGLFRHKKYETPITKDTLQPDKVLFDKAIRNIEHGDYESARLTLNTLINTYDTSEYLAKAYLAIADSWYREGGAHGMAQAEAQYKDFILFYPNMQEAAESQYKICDIHYKQMEKPDRDNSQAQRAEDECRQVLLQFPNAAKFVQPAEQRLREIQEVLADKEYRTGDFYHHKGSFPAAANRMSYVAQQYPLFSSADEALWQLADSYRHMGDRFESQEADALTRLVHDYPLSDHVETAKSRLTALNRPVPQADPVAYARMKAEMDNRTRPGIVHRVLGPFESRPDVNLAAKAGTPAMQSMRPPVPVSVPSTAAGGQSGINDVTVGQAGTEAIDKTPDVRLGTAAANAANGTGEQKAGFATSTQAAQLDAKPAAAADQQLPTNHPPTKEQLKAYQKQQARAAKQAKKAPASKADTAKPDSANALTPAPATAQ